MSIEEVRSLSEANGLKFTDRGNGHVQIEGHGILVNYWPESKKKTAYIAGGESVAHCSAWDAVRLCMISGKTGLKPKKKNISKNKPAFSLKPVTTNPAGIKHFYDGERPPWEFDSRILCQSDRLRISAYRISVMADQMDTGR